jgi:hypothetical protein
LSGAVLVALAAPWAAPGAPAPAQCPGTGDCFVPHPAQGCADPVCCRLVCQMDLSCCAVSWHAGCAALAVEHCLPPAQ